MKKVVAIIPAFNPQNTLVTYVQQLKMIGISSVIIVNDGSDEKYSTVFAELKTIQNCDVLQHEVNFGKGRALKTAFEYILAHFHNYEGVIIVGAHGQHLLTDVQLVLKMTKVFSEGIVLGIRNFHSSDSTFKSYWGNRATSWFFELLFHRKLLDTQSGLRYIPLVELPWLLEVSGEKFEYDTSMLIRAIKRKCPIFEVEIGYLRLKKNSIIHYDEVTNAGEVIIQMLTNYLNEGKRHRK
ncbi:MAG: glycosyltransferase family 2 protein [Lysinibacillus sp.]